MYGIGGKRLAGVARPSGCLARGIAVLYPGAPEVEGLGRVLLTLWSLSTDCRIAVH